ncbi:MAG: acetyl-CoA carboxylase biotin carboxyl carrier protein [Verrucomicrobiota bacterium]|nr:acetyl-CoA carboxylase biotin carboxyl carrier protein [Verrucomicrobiota bacterium]
MRKNDLSVFKMEKEGFKITLKKGNDFQPVFAAAPLPGTSPAVGMVGLTPSAPAPGTDPNHSKEASVFKEITSPMVGTFYTAPSPESPPYVALEQEIKDETVVCIIEAMKVMNEIKAECSGTLAEVVAENGSPVQFGQVLFRVR